ncbi:YqhG family protein [Virgibacillus halodenitrificans]|uniref:YqhG family protein n=1 Tax=Virgibacillus halodenitrificans TaxID=1482 RepID=UPI00045CAF57|nr:YqhG family protein [Virgibacillus halodenitrificans]CDQ35513.1 Bacterial protein YqhG of unknown function [Virgibacillus halodenitrificans]
MAVTDLNKFLATFFSAKRCTIVENKDGVLTVQLTEEMDRALMNRPFYWHYIKKMGNQGDPMQLTLVTNPNKKEVKGEWIHFGSPRLQQIMNYLNQNEKYTKLFQSMNAESNTPLYPWLITNIKVSYKGKHKKDELISIGLHLVNGSMKVEMMKELSSIPLQQVIPDYCYTISPMIKLESGFKRIERVIDDYIERQTHDWAEESIHLLKKEMTLLQHFYSNDDEENSEQQMEKELKEIKNRYNPTITYQVINGGLFYLSPAL